MDRIDDLFCALKFLSQIKAVVFDMDDTLYPETDYVSSGYRQVAEYLKKTYGVKNAFNKLKALFREDKKGVFDRYAALEKLGDGAVVEMLGVYRNQTPDVKLYPQVKKLLKKIRKSGYKTGLLSDGDPGRQRAKATALGLFDYIDEFTFSGDFGEECKKPSPVPFKDICEKLCVSPDQMIYVGDNPKKDFAIKRELPVLTMQAGGGLYRKENYLYGVRPDFILNKPLYGERRGRL